VFCDDGRESEIGNDNGNNMMDTSGYEQSGVQSARLGLDDLVSVFFPAGSGVVAAISGRVN